ncbi:uncharacterized protein Z520_11314 [Fonsecaea multimorphosa CBS 102226]|uniref:Uncharacterized protein n=1 Tax=Fonsecaea multimorphosa CBS 102226 TaxID=1442371 RepID=A0A0D2I743_9EURO|nr:uncharacterized protein Z520_11314 [Fonsecaea multimorphosa CBS 102226]KIX93041.1 hypothetical protein Z520_11314 [Fonsecaea multimorphosa CBS 102226]OAL18288.1 hypothetical protein AYO22_10866 [Fonsecaea multimorphosa]
MGNNYSVEGITSRDLERWERDGRPVMVDRQRRRRSPGGQSHTRRSVRIVRDDGYGGSGGGFQRDHSYPRRPRGESWSGWRRDAFPPSLSTRSAAGRHQADTVFVPASGARPGGGMYRHDTFRGTDTVFHGPRVFDCGSRFARGPGPVMVQQDWVDPPPRRPRPRHHSTPPPSYRGPRDDFRGHNPHFSDGHRMPHTPPFDGGHRGPYMSGGLGRGGPVGGGARGAPPPPERGPERRRIGFRDELLLEDGRAE